MDCGQSKYSQFIYNIHIFQFWAWLLRFLSNGISKSSSFLLYKNFELIFAALYFYIHELKKCVSDFESLISNWRY